MLITSLRHFHWKWATGHWGKWGQFVIYKLFKKAAFQRPFSEQWDRLWGGFYRFWSINKVFCHWEYEGLLKLGQTCSIKLFLKLVPCGQRKERKGVFCSNGRKPTNTTMHCWAWFSAEAASSFSVHCKSSSLCSGISGSHKCPIPVVDLQKPFHAYQLENFRGYICSIGSGKSCDAAQCWRKWQTVCFDSSTWCASPLFLCRWAYKNAELESVVLNTQAQTCTNFVKRVI